MSSPPALRPTFRNAFTAFLLSRRKPLLIAALLCAALSASGYAFLELGRFMAREDPLQKADAIFVFAGSHVERPLEAADLYNDGYAPRIVVTRSTMDQQTFELRRRQVRIPSEHDLSRELLLQLGVPAGALVAPSFIHDNTAEEARTLRELALLHGWRRVIVVSSKYHLRRVMVAVDRQFSDTTVEVLARGSRYDESTPGQWWTRRSDIRRLATEVPKLVAYWIGIGL